MKQIIRAIAFIVGLVPAIAAAQQFPTVPNNSVIGRIGQGTGSGPSQAIPLTTLLSGLNIPFVVPKNYGAVCDGITDDSTALQTAINSAAAIGAALQLPSGNTCFTSKTLNVPSNSSIVGFDRDRSIIKGSASPVFLVTNASNVLFTNFTVQGSNNVTNWNSGTVGAIQFLQNSSATGVASNWTVRGMRFNDFNNAYWVYWGSQTATYAINDPVFEDNIISTTSANVPTDANPLNDNNYGLVMFSATGGNGQFVRPRIKNNRMDAGALCFPIILFGNHTGAEISGNQISNPGRTTPAHCVNGFGTSWNTYGIAIYDLNADGNPATNWIVTNNVIKSPYATGIYIVGNADPAQISNLSYNDCRGCVISGNVVSDQAQQDANPRGGIVVASTTNIIVSHNDLYNGYGGLVVSGQTVGAILVQGNRCTSAVASSLAIAPTCLYLSAGLGTVNNSSQIIRGNYLETTGSGSQTITTVSSNTAQFSNVEISGNTIIAGIQGLVYVNGYASSSFVVNNNKFGGGASGYLAGLTGNSGVPITMMNNVFDSAAGVTGFGLVVTNATVNMSANKFENRTSGSVAMFSGVGATGTIQGTQFNNVVAAAQVAASSIGLAKPSWSGSSQDFVQNLSVGIGAVQTLGWVNTSNGNNWIAVDSISALTSAHLFVGNGSNVPADVALSGDCALANTGAITCTKTNGSSFGALATVTPGTGVATAAGNALSAAGGLTSTIASGTAALGTGAIASGTCATVVTVAATNTATTDIIAASFNGDPTGITGYVPSTSGSLIIYAYPTANNVNFKVCNQTGASITPGAVTLNWRVAR